jgi:hypothetical protein
VETILAAGFADERRSYNLRSSAKIRGFNMLRRVEILFVLLVWFVFLLLSIRVFGPDSAHTEFNSDSAIPVLMSNDDRPVTVFDTYYYGADRWGAWPMLVAKELHRKTGLHWTDERIHVVKTVWLFLGLLVLVYLDTRAAPAMIVSALIAISLDAYLRKRLFDISQLYSWQLTALFLGWLCLRQLFSQRLLKKKTFWAVAFYFCGFFAIWNSVVSAPCLAVLVVVEGLRSYFASQSITKRRFALAVGLLLAATVSELLMKLNYHRYNLKHFGYDYKTPMFFERGYLTQNLLKNWQNLLDFSLFPFIVLSFLFVAGIAVFILYARISGRRAVLNRAVSLFRDDTTTMVVALTAMAVVNFVIMICVSHVRASSYESRFLVPTFIFGVIAGSLTIYLAIRTVANRIDAGRYVLTVAVAGAFIWLCMEFPRPQVSARYQTDRETALILSTKAPGAILMGGYWETYIFPALQPANTMTPLPLEGRHLRIPWTPELLQHAEQVVVEYHRGGLVPQESPPPNELTQYRNRLKLQDPHFYESGEYAFALYLNESRKP